MPDRKHITGWNGKSKEFNTESVYILLQKSKSSKKANI